MMKVPNWLREFFLLPPRPPEPVRRTIIAGGVKTPGTRPKRRHAWRSEASGMPEPRIVRKKVKSVKFPDDGIELAVIQDAREPSRVDFWRWDWLYALLQQQETIRIGENEHFGALRGVDMLIAARREFRRAGIPVEVKLCGQHGFITLLDTNSKIRELEIPW